jgi:hypothetical protein
LNKVAADFLPQGMPVEMKKLVGNAGDFHRATTNHLDVLDEVPKLLHNTLNPKP